MTAVSFSFTPLLIFIIISLDGTCSARVTISSVNQSTKSIREAEAAISESLAGAKSARATVAALAAAGGLEAAEAEAVRDCLVTVDDAVEELRRSLAAMKGARSGRGGGDLGLRIDDVQTWVSAALTDENTCMDGFGEADGEAKRTVRGEIVKVARLIGNALSIVGGLASP